MTQKEKKKEKSTNAKQYHGFRGSYEGPQISLLKNISPTKLESSYGGNVPIYIDANGNFYDLYYLPIKNNKNNLVKEDSIKFRECEISKAEDLSSCLDEENQTRERKLKIYSNSTTERLENIKPFPNPDDYQTFEDFEQAALLWEEQVQETVGCLQSPELVSSQVYCIKEVKTKIFTDTDPKTKSETETDMATETDLVTETEGYGDFDDETINEFKFQEDTPVLKPNEELKIYKMLEQGLTDQNEIKKDEFSIDIRTVLKRNDPWDSTLVPQEPKAKFYQTFDEYERAYRRWSKIVIEQSKYIPMHARQLQQQALLKPYKKKLQKKQIKVFKNFVRGYSSWKNNIIDKIHHQQPFYNDINTLERNLIYYQNTGSNKKKQNNNNGNVDDNYYKNNKTQTKTSFILPPPPPPMQNLYRTKNKTKLNADGVWSNLPEKTKDSINKIFEGLNKKIENNQNLYFNNHQILLGQYKAIFSKPTKSNQLNNFCCLRNDINNKEIEKQRYVCPTTLNKKEVSFIVPIYELKKPIKWIKLEDQKELPNYEEKINLLDRSFRFKKFYSRHNILKIPANHNKNLMKKAKKILKQRSIGFNQIKELLYLAQFYDDFKTLFQKKKNMKKYRTILIDQITSNNFFDLIEIFEETMNKNIHTNLTLYISQIMQSEKSSSILSKCLKNRKLKALYLIAFSLQYFDVLPNSIFPVFNQLFDHIKIKFENSKILTELITNIYLHYYLELIAEQFKDFNEKSNEKIKKNLRELIRTLKNNILEAFKNNLDLFYKFIFPQLTSRSSSINFYFLFIIFRIIYLNDEIILPENNNQFSLTEKLTKIFSSKFIHTQISSKILLNKFQNEKYLMKIVKAYSKDVNVLIDQILNKYSKNTNNKNNNNDSFFLNKNLIKRYKLINNHNYTNSNNDDKNENTEQSNNIFQNGIDYKNIYPRIPFVSGIITEYFISYYKILPKKPLMIEHTQPLLSEQLYNIIIAELKRNIKKQLPTIESIAKLFRSFITCLIELKLITGTIQKGKNYTMPKKISTPLQRFKKITLKSGQLLRHSSSGGSSGGSSGEFRFNKTPKKNKMKRSSKNNKAKNQGTVIVVKEVRLLQFLALIKDSPETAFQFKKLLIKSLFSLLKERSVYLDLYQSGLIFERLHEFCSNVQNTKLNKISWKLFYKLILYHSETLKFLIKNNLLKQFIDLLTTSYGIGVVNQLYYLNKLFKMASIEREKSEKNLDYQFIRHYESNPLKTYRKDCRLLVNFFESNLHFTRFTRLYKSYIKTFNGAPFIRLSQLYYTIISERTCVRLLNEFKKSQEYKEAIVWYTDLRKKSNQDAPKKKNKKKSKKKSKEKKKRKK
ncbi:sca1 complex scaffold protein scaa [Anaeramoeba flamelloides]|uniref:Sca1 complex scaffold protein scaa n=1 Tax=Anaeramoeba flamelloides TaxID=1746091 RepID=A0ABQ8Y5C2_9EUKA|nr:sca1 complex scaffold protein scaa [Anaeramoeba flamelloides]